MFMPQGLSGWMTVCSTHQKKKHSKNFVKFWNTLDS